jgi:hypothetical protein
LGWLRLLVRKFAGVLCILEILPAHLRWGVFDWGMYCPLVKCRGGVNGKLLLSRVSPRGAEQQDDVKSADAEVGWARVSKTKHAQAVADLTDENKRLARELRDERSRLDEGSLFSPTASPKAAGDNKELLAELAEMKDKFAKEALQRQTLVGQLRAAQAHFGAENKTQRTQLVEKSRELEEVKLPIYLVRVYACSAWLSAMIRARYERNVTRH